MRIERIAPYLWRIPPEAKPGMRVPALVVADEALMAQIRTDASLDQLANGATLPGIVRAALAMPDIHQGYGLPVGGVVATDAEHGVVSPGAIGFDINCGVRLLRTRPGSRRGGAAPGHARRCALRHDPDRRGLPGRVSPSAPPSCARSWPRGRPGPSSVGGAIATTSSTSSPRAGSPAPSRTRCPSTRWSGGGVSWARWARGTTSWRFRSWTRSTTSRRPRISGCGRAGSR